MTGAEIETADFNVMDCGTIYILNTQTDAAREWVAEHIPDDAQTFGQCGTVVEHRYIGEIVAGIQRDGLTVD